MLLLNRILKVSGDWGYSQFTFQYASIKPSTLNTRSTAFSSFTFQYASIKPYQARCQGYGTAKFTFQYASIKPYIHNLDYKQSW